MDPLSLPVCPFSGLVLSVFLAKTIHGVAAAPIIQAAWRSHNLRGTLPVMELVLKHRAAKVIQRAYKRYLMRQRFAMLGQIKTLVQDMSNMLLGGSMALSVRSSHLLKARAIRKIGVFPEHRMTFVFDKFNRVHVVVPDGQPRVGLPRWLGSLVSTMTFTELHALYGKEQKVYSQVDAVQILLNGTIWRNPNGDRLELDHNLPLPTNDMSQDDCLLQVGLRHCSANQFILSKS